MCWDWPGCSPPPPSSRSGAARRNRRSAGEILGPPAGSGHHQLDDLLGDVRLEPLGMALVDAHDVGDDPPLFGVGIDVDLRPPRPWQQAPRRRRASFPQRVVDLPGLLVDDVWTADAFAGAVAVGPW